MKPVLLPAFFAALLSAGQIEVPWSELGPRVTDRKVALVLPDGSRVEGKVHGVEPEGLRMSKGNRLIPRKSITVLHVTEYGKRGRLLATLGAVAATAGISAAKYPDIYEGPAIIAVPAAVAGGITGSAVAGYFIGKRIDRRVTEIRIARD
ncbi:MAG: hypothetical protein ACE15B_22250 [Bryobacteraceae bacterium]